MMTLMSVILVLETLVKRKNKQTQPNVEASMCMLIKVPITPNTIP